MNVCELNCRISSKQSVAHGALKKPRMGVASKQTLYCPPCIVTPRSGVSHPHFNRKVLSPVPEAVLLLPVVWHGQLGLLGENVEERGRATFLFPFDYNMSCQELSKEICALDLLI